ncbi:MAG TPA: hypothetical protein ENH60_05580 [Pricia sp.]|nr:hypothetical protein [Pricia sp.]HEC64630.1 hypothetical protein [bacterium]
MSWLTKERSIFAVIILVLVGVVAYGAIWFTSNYALVPVPKEEIKNVEVCIDNHVACSLIYESTEDIPE